MMKKNGFSRCAEMYIGRLRKEGRYSTAHVYENALFSFRGFCGTSTVSFGQITREHLRCYGQYLYERGLKPNTVSTYMRMLRSIYNRGVESGRAPYVHRLFHEVYTGVECPPKESFAGNRVAQASIRRSEIGSFAAYAGYCCFDVSILRYVVRWFGTFGEVILRPECYLL